MIKIKPGIISLTLIIIFAFIYGVLPYWASYQIRLAVEQGDAAKLAQYINYPALEQNFKQQAKKVFGQTLQADMQNQGVSRVGDLVANMLVGQMMDSYASVEGLRLLMQGARPELLGINPVSLESTTLLDASYTYQRLDQFVMSFPAKAGGQTNIVLQCFGLSWKVVAIELP